MKISRTIIYPFLLFGIFAVVGYFIYQLSQKISPSTPAATASPNVTQQGPAGTPVDTSVGTNTATNTPTVSPIPSKTPILVNPTVSNTPVPCCTAVLKEGLTLRGGPGMNYFRTYFYPQGTEFDVSGISEDKGWFAVQLKQYINGGTGWAPIDSFDYGFEIDRLSVTPNPIVPTQVTTTPGPDGKTPNLATPTVTPPKLP